MRKVSAIVLATFYLLLSTGAFACIVHFTSKTFLLSNHKISQNTADKCNNEKRPAYSGHAAIDHNQVKNKKHSHKKDDCGPGKNCNCCKNHGMYVVRENVRTSVETDLTGLVAVLPPVIIKQLDFKSVLVLLPHQPQATGPPGVSPLPIYLKVRSLLI